MNVLALDTCFGACSVAVGKSSSKLAFEFETRQTGHAEALMPMIDRVMSGSSLRFSDIDRVAVTSGPGSFTGMRIGIAAARALALTIGAELIGIPTLEVMAETARVAHRKNANGELPEHILVAVDARKDEVYAQLFGPDDGRSIASAQVMLLRAAALLLPPERTALVGSGARAVYDCVPRDRVQAVDVIETDLQPHAVALAMLAFSRVTDKVPVRPLYLRPPDAKPQAGKSIARLS